MRKRATTAVFRSFVAVVGVLAVATASFVWSTTAEAAKSKPGSRSSKSSERRSATKVDCTDPCTREGLCSVRKGECAATSAKHCSAAAVCAQSGRCSLNKNRCAVTSTEQCAASTDCTHGGRCHFVLDRCEPVLASDCQKSVGCMESGACSLKGTACAVVSGADCALSNLCKLAGKCTFAAGQCVVGRELDARATSRVGGGFVAGVTLGAMSIAAAPDPTLYTGVGVRAGWALDLLTILVGAEIYLPGSFTNTRTAVALNSSLAQQQIEQEQGVTTSVLRAGAWANYYLIGGHREAFSLYTLGGLGLMQYALDFDEVPRKSGYEKLGNDPMRLSVIQLDTGLGLEVRAGPVHGVVDFKLGLPVAGGLVGTLDMSSPVALAIHAGVRMGL